MSDHFRPLLRSESGGATLEFITVAIVFLFPLLALAVTLGSYQVATIAAENTARSAARAWSAGGSAETADSQAQAFIADMRKTLGNRLADVNLTRKCVHECLDPSSEVEMRVTVKMAAIPLPWPSWLSRFMVLDTQSVAQFPVSRFGTARR